MALTIQRLRTSNTPLPPHASYGTLCYGVTFTFTTLGFFSWSGEVDHSPPSSVEVENELNGIWVPAPMGPMHLGLKTGPLCPIF
jgi:hypothetical protein